MNIDADEQLTAAPTRHDIKFLEPTGFDDPLIAKVSSLHAEFLPFGAMSALGTQFVRKVGYELPLQCEVMNCIVCQVDGSIAGYVAYAESTDFRRKVLSRRIQVGFVTLRALVRKPSRIKAFFHSFMVAQDLKKSAGRQGGEITALVVKPEFASAAFSRAAGFRMSERLLDMALAALQKNKVAKARALVDDFNKPMLFLYAKYGAEFIEIDQAGRKMVEIWIDTGSRSGG
jgi:ribosomal protein S18 acetylase RimI-like enzyme